MGKPLPVDKALRQAKTLSRKGDTGAAKQVYEEILERFPQNARAQEGLAQLRRPGRLTGEKARLPLELFQAGRYDEGLAQAEALYAEHADSAFLNHLIGLFHGSLGNHRAAVVSFRRAIELNPQYGEAHCNLGHSLSELEAAEEGLPHLHKALALMSNPGAAHLNIGRALNQLGRADEAVPHLKKAAEHSPDPGGAHNNLGNSFKHLGQFDRAAEAYEAAIAHRPRLAPAHRHLSEVHTYAEGDSHIATLEGLLQEETKLDDRAQIAFALSKAYEDLGDDAKSFEMLALGNRLKKTDTGYSIDGEAWTFATMKRWFADPPAPLPVGDTGQKPIFIVGMPRSGTSLLEQILASHSQVFGAGERASLPLAVRPILNENPAAIDRDALERIRESYLDATKALGRDEPFVTDKLPLNFRWIGFIAAALPEATIIHIRRNPIATGWSIYKHYFPAAGMNFGWDLADIAGYLDLHDDLMAFWHETFPGRILDLQYEDLTENQEEKSREVLAHCGLAWEDACLDFHRTKRVVNTASSTQVRRKMYKGSSEAWRKYEDRLEPLLKRAG